MSQAPSVLVADIGGTNARFGIVDAGGLRDVVHIQCSQYPGLEPAAQSYLKTVNAMPQHGIFSIAGPVDGDDISLTNLAWHFKTPEVQSELNLKSLRIINDFEAVAYAAADINPAFVQKICGGEPVAGFPKVVIGPGTGLGVGCLVHVDGRYVAIPGEGGHVTMAAKTQREFDIFQQLLTKYHHVSGERVCSGKGLENLYRSICALDNKTDAPDLKAPQISEKALNNTCSACAEALDLMFAFLGRMAGNLALILKARGGVYIAGGIPAKLGDYLERSRFTTEFQSKGRMSEVVIPIPVYMATHEDMGLLGLAELARAIQQKG